MAVSLIGGDPGVPMSHSWKDEFGSFNLETFQIPNALRELGSSLYFIYFLYKLIYFFFSYTYFFSFFLFLSSFFICSP
jgi:hypothetical protein